jgi:hypothetical protein
MIADRRPSTAARGHGAGLASSPDRLAAALRMLSPLSVKPVGVVDEPVEDGVGDSWVGDHLVRARSAIWGEADSFCSLRA